MGFVDKLSNYLDSHRRGLYHSLQELGIPVQLADRGRPEAKITGWRVPGFGRFGLIDIADGPIRWVNVTDDGDGGKLHEYGIPDTRIGPTFSAVQLLNVQVRAFPLLGKVIDARWQGKDYGLDLISHLSGDDLIRNVAKKFRYMVIKAYPRHSCWILTIQEHSSPSQREWDCYQSIAHHLLDAQATQNNP